MITQQIVTIICEIAHVRIYCILLTFYKTF